MFERRLKFLLILLTVLAVGIVVRLVDIQILHAEEYEALATRLMTHTVRHLPASRGTIRDRQGRPLVADVPAADICMHYGVLTGRPHYLNLVARELQKRGDADKDNTIREIADELRRVDIVRMWQRLSELTDRPLYELVERKDRIQARVERIRAHHARRTGVLEPVKEENWLHPLVEAADDAVALAVRMELEKSPWLKYPLVRVVPSSKRVAHDADPLVHLLGRVGAASRERIEADPLADDDLRRLRSGDLCGISGVERLAEPILRGTRGRIVEDFDRRELEHTDAIRGRDVYLTIDADLQRQIYQMFEQGYVPPEEEDRRPFPAGCAAVVIDVATREVLALVSYPAYRYDTFSADYDRLRRDTRWMPLRFRPVAEHYPPGSTCKAITLVGALGDGVVTEQERIHCRGHLLLEQPNKFRCWIYNQFQTTHDAYNPAGQNAEDAIRNSCNIYFYTVGGRLGVDRICTWFSRFGLGRTQGTGLIEEAVGIVPTAQWIAEHRGRDPRVRPADAWNFSIGPGEVSATPLQVANVAATVAAGRWEPVVLVRDEAGSRVGPPPPPAVQFDERILHPLRVGMWRVVNERGGTAWRTKLRRSDFEMCGKTGSAQASRRVIRKKYVLRWPDGRTEEVTAVSKRDALSRFGEPKPEVIADSIHELFPPTDAEGPSHAWFIGYTQPAETRHGDAPRGRVYAFSVIVEFGGSGGRVAGPVAQGIAESLLEREDP